MAIWARCPPTSGKPNVVTALAWEGYDMNFDCI
jgi:hypothetical protein